jgi:hypothetical protein
MRRIGPVFLTLALALGLAGPDAARAADNCVTACEAKADQCARSCEELAQFSSDDPASLRDCQVACARNLFVSCFDLCSETNVVVEDDYGLVAPYTKDAPLPTE